MRKEDDDMAMCESVINGAAYENLHIFPYFFLFLSWYQYLNRVKRPRKTTDYINPVWRIICTKFMSIYGLHEFPNFWWRKKLTKSGAAAGLAGSSPSSTSSPIIHWGSSTKCMRTRRKGRKWQSEACTSFALDDELVCKCVCVNSLPYICKNKIFFELCQDIFFFFFSLFCPCYPPSP